MNHTNEIHTTDAPLLNFDPIVVVLDVVKRWLLIVVFVLGIGVGTYIYKDLTYKPVYQTNTTFVVSTRGSSSTVFGNLSSTTNLAAVFSDLLNSSILRKAIVQELGTSFDGTITATAVPETNLLNMTVTASDPRTAFVVTEAIIAHHETVTYQVVDEVSLELLMRPTVPTAPANPQNSFALMKKLMLYAGAAAVALLAVLSYFSNKVRSAREARSKLDCSYLGEIPHESKHRTLTSWLNRRKTSILITSPITSFRFIETIRKLRRRVEQRMRGGKVLMVTSLLENEGKSTVAVNLALAMAQKKARVLLMDCDLRKPACFQLLEHREFTHTVSDVLGGKCTAEEALLHEKNGNLWLMLERRGHSRSGDLIASSNMRQLIDWAKQEFDFVVLDLPPMGEVSDAESMTKYADASLLVIRQNIAPAPAINKAAEALGRGNAKMLGCVLNNVYSTFLSSGQGYGYGYGKYGRYGKYGKYGKYGNQSKAPQNAGK